MKKGSKPHDGGFNGLKPCGAKGKRTGKPCQQPAMPNGRCRLHGGKSTGRPVITGSWTKEAKQQKKAVSQLIKEMKSVLTDL